MLVGARRQPRTSARAAIHNTPAPAQIIASR
jgi:hypothetical protein